MTRDPTHGDTGIVVLFVLFLLMCHYISGTAATIRYDRDALLHIGERVGKLNEIPSHFSSLFVDTDLPLATTGPSHSDSNTRRVRKRGRRGGALSRLRQRCFRPPLPSMFVSNIQSLPNKIDELTCNIQTKRDYRDCSVYCFSETWLNADIPDSAVQPPGFSLYRHDRSTDSGKHRGGGVCFLVNTRWCTDVKVLSSACTPDVEFLTIQCRPFYLPREMSCLTLIAVYIHPAANVPTALRLLADEINACETSCPDGTVIVAGDFNKANLKKELPKLYQQVDCATRGDKTLDHCYTSIKGAYHAIRRAPLGRSDHNMVYLVPSYRQKLRTEKPVVKTVKQWTTTAVETLQGCFDCTDWNVFKDEATDLDEYTEIVCDYISFCENVCVPAKTIKIFPNDKPWCNGAIRKKLHEKEIAFRSDDKPLRNKSKRELEKCIKRAKFQYKKKIEDNLTANNSRNVWTGLQTMTDYKMTRRSADTTDPTLPDTLNTFYSRFDTQQPPTFNVTEPTTTTAPAFTIQESDVRRNFSRLKIRKAAGPDNISPGLLRNCAAQLSVVLTDIFNMSLQSCMVPHCFKKSTIIPVPKKTQPICLNDYRPVALTSVIMKTFERIVLRYLKTCIPPSFDPFQFAYRENRSVEDAISIGLHHVLSHLENPNSYARILFIDYSSAFNTIVPTKLYSKLKDLMLPESICTWIIDFLRGRPQVVKIGDFVSSTRILNVGAPQGCVLSPLLYSLFTYDCATRHVCNTMVKFADDTTLEGLITNDDETSYRDEVLKLVSWCEENNLELNVSKTKEMILDFRKTKPDTIPLLIKDKQVEIVSEFKFLGLVISNDLKWEKNTVKIVKKAQQRLFFLRRLKKFGVKTEILINFYRAIIESVLTFAMPVWYGSISKAESASLNRIVKTASKIIGAELPSLDDIYNKRLIRKARSIALDESHPAFELFEMLPSGRRYRSIRTKTNRFTNSFFPKAVNALSSTTSQS